MTARKNNSKRIALLRASVATAVLFAVASPALAGGVNVGIGGHTIVSTGGGGGGALGGLGGAVGGLGGSVTSGVGNVTSGGFSGVSSSSNTEKFPLRMPSAYICARRRYMISS